MTQQPKRILAFGITAMMVAMLGATFTGVSYAQYGESETTRVPRLPRCDRLKLPGLAIDCTGKEGQSPAVVVIYRNGQQIPCSCNATLEQCDARKTSTSDSTTSSSSMATCLSGNPLVAIPRNFEAIRGSCTVCSTVGGERICFTNNNVNC